MRSNRRPAALAVAISFALAIPIGVAIPIEVWGATHQEQRDLWFEEVTQQVGLDFRHFSGRSAAKHVPETMGGGVVWQDFDVDGFGDVYLVDSGPYEALAPLREAGPGAGRNVLFRSSRDGTLSRVDAGVDDAGFGMGAAAADYDADGYVDLYVTNFGADVLYRNNGDGTFSDVTSRSGMGDPRWGTSAAWGDLDLDGYPELFVANYLAYETTTAAACGNLEEEREYCPPELHDGTADALYHNRDGIRFEDVAVRAGVANPLQGKGLGVVVADLDDDGMLDMYVANDATPNFVYMNRGDLRFEDVGLFSGGALSFTGLPQAGMGVDAGDLDGDGRPEIGVTNYEEQPVNIYRTIAPELYTEASVQVGIGPATEPTLGFGILFVDADADGDRDVFVANGHALDTDDWYAQPNQAFRNNARGSASSDGSSMLFEEVSVGPPFAHERVSRGLALGDHDGDGRPDLLVTNLDDTPQLLLNRSTSPYGRLVIRLRGRGANRDGFGARVTVTSTIGDETLEQTYESRSSSSYLSQSRNEIYVGLHGAAGARIRVRWPGGSVEDLGEVAAGRRILAIEGRGIVASTPLRPSRLPARASSRPDRTPPADPAPGAS